MLSVSTVFARGEDPASTDLSRHESAIMDEDVEAGKLFDRAQELLERQQTEQALLLLGEIVEFFPRSPYFIKACIQSSSLQLLNHKPNISEELLKRLAQTGAVDADLQTSILVAHWDFFIKQRDITLLQEWILRRNPTERLQLSRHPQVREDLKQLIGQKPLSELLKLFQDLGIPEPTVQLLENCEALGKTLPSDVRLELLDVLLEIHNEAFVIRSLALLEKHGLQEKAHKKLLEKLGSQVGLELGLAWIRFLIQGHLYAAASERIDSLRMTKHTRREQFFILLGEEQWEPAYRFVSTENRIKEFSLEDLKILVLKLWNSNLYRGLAEDLLKHYPESASLKIMKARLSKDTGERLTLLGNVALEYPEVADQALLEMARLGMRLQRQEFSRKVLLELLEKYPNSPLCRQAEDDLRNLEFIYPTR